MKQVFLFLGMLLSVSTAAASGKMVPYTVNSQAYEGYYAKASDNAPLVLLIHDWDGLTAYEVKRADMLAELGYNVFAADLFGAGVRPTKTEDKRRLAGELYKNREKMRALVKGALDAAGANGADTGRVVVMGYCFGGAAVLEFARSGADMTAFVSFHGGLATPPGQDYANTKGKVLILHGTADTSVTMDDFANLAKELEQAGVPHEMITYGGAPHAFTVYGSDRYRRDADEKSWARFIAFLSENLK